MIRIRMHEDNSDTIQTFKDFIDTKFEAGDITGAEAYRKRLLDMFGIDYDPKTNSSQIVPSLDVTFGPSDFHFYKEYLRYVDGLFKLRFTKNRGLLTGKYANKVANVNNMIEMLGGLGVKATTVSEPGNTIIAYVTSGKLRFNLAQKQVYKDGNVSTSILVHELGHVVEDLYHLFQFTDICHALHYCSSNYNLTPAEVFAEHFSNYFLEPKYLKAGWPEVYKKMDKVIPAVWKEAIFYIIG